MHAALNLLDSLLTRVGQVDLLSDGLDNGIARSIHSLGFQPVIKLVTVLHRVFLYKRGHAFPEQFCGRVFSLRSPFQPQ